jgi:O-antigen ligase
MSDPRTRIAALLLAAVSGLLIWWGWKQGAYFGGVFYPGALLAFLLLAMVLVLVPFDGRIRGPALVALAALTALAAWMLLSAVWSPRPAAAVADAWHGFLYAALFALGLWVVNLLRARMALALTPVAIAVAVLGVATAVVLATGADVTWYLHEDATLRFPIGYRNANAAFWMIGLWALLPLITESGWRWELRALLAGAGTLLVELTVLSQSRASIPAIALAGLVFLALSRNRLRATVALVLVFLPALPALPTLLDVYHYGNAAPGVVPLLRDAARAIAATAALSVVVGALALGWVGPRLRLGPRTASRIGRVLAIAAALTVVAVGSVFVARHGGPVGFVDQRIEEFGRIGYPDLRGQGIRYGVNVGSNRGDFWRVAAREGLDRPLLGGGAGSFEVAYLERRRSDNAPEDPHSVEALMLSELGFPGLLLLATFLVGAVLAGLRSRRLGPGAAALVAGSLAVAAQWLVQTSVDWIWNYPGVTAPAIFLLGAAAAPALLDPGAARARRIRALGAAALAALALLAVPLYLSGRYVQRARGEEGSEPRTAIADFGRAADLDPLAAEPLLAKAAIQSRLGERGPALATLREAADREPRNYAVQLLVAAELRGSDPAAAREAIRRARQLNPDDPTVKAVWRRLAAGSTGR